MVGVKGNAASKLIRTSFFAVLCFKLCLQYFDYSLLLIKIHQKAYVKYQNNF
jgi:hypothetical protein